MAPRCVSLGLGDEARAKFLQLKNACRAVGGCFTLLWHNSEFRDRAKKHLYQEVLSG